MIGNHREPWPIAATAQSHCLVCDRSNGQFLVVIGGRYIPERPYHDDIFEALRLGELWSRVCRWVGYTGPELMEKFDRRDLADCIANVVTYTPLDSHREFEPSIPIFPLGSMPRYCPPFSGDPWHWAPNIPDRLNAKRRPILEATLARHQIDAKIGEFFRPADQLGLANNERAALAEFRRFFVERKLALEDYAEPVPSLSDKMAEVVRVGDRLPTSSSAFRAKSLF